MDANIESSTPTVRKPKTDSVLAPASALQKGAKLKEYVITGVIGEGGFGIVYAAQDTLLKRHVAIKEYMPAAIASRLSSAKVNLRSSRHQQAFDAGLQGFIEEARLLAQFKHNALVEILRFWEANDTAYMVMPHYSGKTLRNLLRQDRYFCEENWLKKILAPILDAVELLHQNHIFHRDIAPDNIVIQNNDQPVLLDLGSARRVIAGMQSALTVVVKPGYAPIEQYTEDTINEQGPWTDIYALGAVLYFAITGSAPSASVSRMMRDTMKSLTSADYPNYSNDFLSAINRALALRPCDRFQTVKEFRSALALNTLNTLNTLNNAKPLTTQKASLRAVTASQPDDEITQILSEAEINQFKEKLLQTITSTKPIENNTAKAVVTPTSSAADTSTRAAIAHEEIVKHSQNLLANTQPIEAQSISSFEDVRELLESPPVIKTATKASNTKANSNVSEKSVAAQILKPNKVSAHRSLLMVGFIGTLISISIVLAGIYFFGQDKVTPNEFSEEVTPSVIQEHAPKEILSSDSNKAFTDHQNEDNKLAAVNTNSIAINSSPVKLAEDQKSGEIIDTSEANLLGNQLIDTQNVAQDQLPTEDKAVTPIEPSSPNAATNSVNHNQANRIGESKETAIRENSNNQASIEFATAKLTILPWGEVWVDNQRYGVSPPIRELSLTPGTYNIELRNPGLPNEYRTLTLGKGENPTIYHNFTTPQAKPRLQEFASALKNQTSNASTETPKASTQEAESGNDESQKNSNSKITTERNIAIKVLPWGEIYLDGKMVGITPPLHQLKLAPGAHVIEIKHPSYSTKTIHISETDPATAIIEHRFQ